MQDYRKLEIWQRGMDYTTKLYKLSSTLPSEEKYGLISQLRRAAYSIPLNIAEGAGCESKKEFKLFLEYAHRSVHEVLTILELCIRLHLCDKVVINNLIEEGREIRAMIYGFMKKL